MTTFDTSNRNDMGRAFVFGNDIDTDALAPGAYMKGGIESLAAHCLESVNATFAGDVKAGDVIIAGSNFGMGSSREQAAEALKVLGVAGVVAVSFAGIFYRNAINLGLPVFTAKAEALAVINDGSPVRLDIVNANLETETGVIRLEPLPDFLLDMIQDGGLVPHLKKRLEEKAHGTA